jgi:hypothetical protein
VTKFLVAIAKAPLGVQAAEAAKEAALIAIGKIIKQYIGVFPAEFKNPLISGILIPYSVFYLFFAISISISICCFLFLFLFAISLFVISVCYFSICDFCLLFREISIFARACVVLTV